MGGDGKAYWSRCYVRTIYAETQLARNSWPLRIGRRRPQPSASLQYPSERYCRGGEAEQRRCRVPVRWGLVPYWWKKPVKQMAATFNARAETVASTPTFRDAFKRHRCIVPASGPYEWPKRPDGRQPYFISAADGEVLSFSAFWDRWKPLRPASL
jgi:putative SOS response-associated peptidase YedK